MTTHVAYFYNGPLREQWLQLPSPVPVYRVPMPPCGIRAMFAEGAPPDELLTIRVGEYERDVIPSRKHSHPNEGVAVWLYFWKGVQGGECPD